MAKNPARRRRSQWLPEGSRLCRCRPLKANFFLRENLFLQAFGGRNGKRNRRANLCGLQVGGEPGSCGQACEKPMKSFLLPCECGRLIPVGPGQAGGQVRCDRCGTVRDVPRLGDLARFAVQQSSGAAAPRRWTAAHACLVGGTAVAVSATIAALMIVSPAGPAVDVAAVRQAVSNASPGEVHRVWKQISRGGVARPQLPHERRLEQMARVAGDMSRWLTGLAVLGGAVAVASAASLLARKPQAQSSS